MCQRFPIVVRLSGIFVREGGMCNVKGYAHHEGLCVA